MRKLWLAVGALTLILGAGLFWLLNDSDASAVAPAGSAAIGIARTTEQPIELEAAARRELEPPTAPEPSRAPPEQFAEPSAPAVRVEQRFFARVVDDQSGAPLMGVRATVGSTDELIAGRGLPLEGDSAGHVEISALSWKHLLARIEARDHAWVLVPLGAGHEQLSRAREVRLPRSASLWVNVTGPLGEALQGASVTLSTDTYQMVQVAGAHSYSTSIAPPIWTARTDADGRAQLEGLPPAVPLSLEARAEGMTSYRAGHALTLLPGETRELAIALGAGARVAGQLLDPDGTALDDVELWMISAAETYGVYFQRYGGDGLRKTRSVAGGRFAFEDVADGDWLVGPGAKGPYAPRAEVLAVRDGRAERELVLTAWPALYVTGSVVDPAGQPVQASVLASSSNPTAVVGGTVDRELRFRIGPLAPGTFRVSASPQGESAARLSPSEPVMVEAGASDVILTLQPGGRIAGRVLDGISAEPLAGMVTLSRFRDDPARGWASLGSSSIEGEFEFTGLAPGTYDLAASTTTGASCLLSGLRIEAGDSQDGLVLRVMPGGLLRVRFDGGQEYGQFRVLSAGHVVALDGVQRGTEATWVVPAGSLEVLCSEWKDGVPHTRSQTISVGVGERGEVRFGVAEEQR